VAHLHLPAVGDTAIRAVTRSSTGTSSPPSALRARDRSVAVWNVATTAQSAARTASTDRLGVVGSCTCSTSNRPPVPPPPASQRRTRPSATGPNRTRATEPL
jgi:hypothetical protein